MRSDDGAVNPVANEHGCGNKKKDGPCISTSWQHPLRSSQRPCEGSGQKDPGPRPRFRHRPVCLEGILPSFTPYYRSFSTTSSVPHSFNPDCFDFRRYTTLDAYVDDLLNILDALRVDRCAYVGHSVSAMIGILASIRRPELFTKLIFLGASPRFLNDKDYHGGFERGEIEKVLYAMEANYEAWVNGFAPLAVGADVPDAVREFSRTLFNMRPDISLFVSLQNLPF
ncbi:putative strigolactone esterase DAD2 [Morella rubra]|uniref:Putative strigolactone esterase DAD2 n=1 Tax=Morella rubra TaxID=262757 RepID=A0A6A1UY80_9ROSI|nr:putative strigolactone esterase DAD2 [Morella rubra]